MLTYHLFKSTGIIAEQRYNEEKFCRYLRKIESGYDSNNPYHNRCAGYSCGS